MSFGGNSATTGALAFPKSQCRLNEVLLEVALCGPPTGRCEPAQRSERQVIAMAPMTVVLILFLVSGAILIGISIPLIQGRVGPNHWYGFRVRRTLEDPKVWYPANRYAGWRMLGLGVAVIVVATPLYFVPDIDVAVYASIVGGVGIAGVILGLVQSFRYLRQLTSEKEAATR
jgi:hypothetical protein